MSQNTQFLESTKRTSRYQCTCILAVTPDYFCYIKQSKYSFWTLFSRQFYLCSLFFTLLILYGCNILWYFKFTTCDNFNSMSYVSNMSFVNFSILANKFVVNFLFYSIFYNGFLCNHKKCNDFLDIYLTPCCYRKKFMKIPMTSLFDNVFEFFMTKIELFFRCSQIFIIFRGVFLVSPTHLDFDLIIFIYY